MIKSCLHSAYISRVDFYVKYVYSLTVYIRHIFKIVLSLKFIYNVASKVRKKRFSLSHVCSLRIIHTFFPWHIQNTKTNEDGYTFAGNSIRIPF